MLSEKRRSSGIGLGSPPFQHLIVRSAFHNFQEVCLCKRFSILHSFGNWTDLEETLSQDMTTLLAYLQTWRLKFSHTETVMATFHLNNRGTKCELKVYNSKRFLQFCPTPTYLGVKLYKSLTFCRYLVALHKKLYLRVVLLRRLVSSGWGAVAKTCPIWSGVLRTILVSQRSHSPHR